MPALVAAPSTHFCPSCAASAPLLGPPSRTTGSVVACCAGCGTHWLSNPTDDVAGHYDYDREAYAGYVAAKRNATVQKAYETVLARLGDTIQSGGRALFDVGAGAGEFLDLARRRGFEPHGNELAPGAIEMAKEDAGVDLHFGDLASIEGENLYDAMTMWCVLAHVRDPDALLADTLRILKPGGVLFLQTPRWSGMDTVGLAAAKVSKGRITRVLDRRVNDAHLVLNSVEGIRLQAEHAGFDVLEATALARYSLRTDSYLRSLGVPQSVGGVVARGLDLAVDRNLFFRNVIDLYARKPLA